MPVQGLDLSAVTDATFNGSAVKQINLNGSEIWVGSNGAAIFYNNGGTQTILPDNIPVYSISNGSMTSLAPIWLNQTKLRNSFGFMNHNGKLTLVFTHTVMHPTDSTQYVGELTDANRGALPAQYFTVNQTLPTGILDTAGGGYFGKPYGLFTDYKATIVATLGDDGNFPNLDQTFAAATGSCLYGNTTIISMTGRVQISNNTITTWGGYKNESAVNLCGTSAWNSFSLPSPSTSTGSVTWDSNSLSFSSSANITFGGYSKNYGTANSWSSKLTYNTLDGVQAGWTQTGLNSILQGTHPDTGTPTVNIGGL